MFSATAHVIRPARTADVPELVRLGWATHDTWPRGPILVGEIGGVVGAALAIDGRRAVMTDMPGAGHLLAQLRARATGIVAHATTPCLAERLRQRLRPAAA